MPAVVSDSSPLISLAHLGHFNLLRDFYGQVLIPVAVQQEMLRREFTAPGAAEMTRAIADTWMCVRQPTSSVPLPPGAGVLDMGEREALQLALEAKADLLLIDEIRGRTVARSLGLKITGTIGVLLEAKTRRLIPSLQLELDRLRARTNFYLSPALYTASLQMAGETP